jgi:hypothetical protein
LTKPESPGARLDVAACSVNYNSARERLLIVIVSLERRIVFSIVVLIIGHLKQTLEVHMHGALMANYDLQSPWWHSRCWALAMIDQVEVLVHVAVEEVNGDTVSHCC